MLKCALSTADGLWWGAGGEGLNFLQGADHWELNHAPVSIWPTQIGFFFNFVLGVVTRAGRAGVDWEDRVIREDEVNFPKYI